MKFNRLIPELAVSHLRNSLGFYSDVLGFVTLYDRKEEGFIFLEKEGAQLMLEQYEKDARMVNGVPEKPFGRGINFQIEIADVDALHKKLTDKNYPVFCPLEEKWYRCGDFMAGNRQFVIADPDGYLLRFYTDIGKKPI